jgi:hypothetical protein
LLRLLWDALPAAASGLLSCSGISGAGPITLDRIHRLIGPVKRSDPKWARDLEPSDQADH